MALFFRDEYANCWIRITNKERLLSIIIYCIAGNFGEVFNLVNWRFYGKSPNLKSAIFYSDIPGICHAAKFKTRQFVPGTDSPNLMLAKVSRYTVVCVTLVQSRCQE